MKTPKYTYEQLWNMDDEELKTIQQKNWKVKEILRDEEYYNIPTLIRNLVLTHYDVKDVLVKGIVAGAIVYSANKICKTIESIFTA